MGYTILRIARRRPKRDPKGYVRKKKGGGERSSKQKNTTSEARKKKSAQESQECVQDISSKNREFVSEKD